MGRLQRAAVIVFHDEFLARQIAQAAGTYFNPDCDICIARVEDGELLGGVVYTNFTGHSIGMHVAGFRDNWVNRDLLWVCFDYPFRQLGVSNIFGLVPASNSKALAFNQNLGFKIITTIPGVFDDGGMIVMMMAKQDCRWLRLKPRGLAPNSEVLDGRQVEGASAP